MFCWQCGASVPNATNFCPECGQDLAATAQISTRRPEQPTDLEEIRDALKDEYEIEEELGRGGMAIVYQAREKALDRNVAVKVLPFSLAHDEEFVERFEREARTAAKLEHPNIVPIYRVGKVARVGRDGDIIYFVMKFLRQQSLADVIEERGRLTPKEIRKLLIECAGALGYASQHGIVHRDVKPDNIMFNEAAQAVVTDFGIAKAASGTRLTGTGKAIGTPYYMSPEQARAQPIDGRSDIYSLGVVAFQCLVGTVPFDGEDSFAVGLMHIANDLPTPELDTGAQKALFQIIQKMMEKEPADRFQTAEELIAALKSEQAVGPAADLSDAATAETVARPDAWSVAGPATPTTPMPSALPATAPKKKRSKVLVGALAFLVLGSVGGGGYLVFAGSDDGLIANPDVPDRGEIVADVAAAAGPATDQPSDSQMTEVAADSQIQTEPPPPTPAEPETPPEGTLVLTGLPRQASVRIDGTPVRGTVQTLEPGSHRLRILAPGYEPFSRNITISAGDTVQTGVTMTPVPAEPEPTSQCADFNDTYNLAGECFDSRPTPRDVPLVPLTDQIQGTPGPAVLAIRVELDGSVSRVLPVRPSNNAEFTKEALLFARSMRFNPAQKNGRPIVAWTQQVFQPKPR
jgi:serine/threonine-protein kinase